MLLTITHVILVFTRAHKLSTFRFSPFNFTLRQGELFDQRIWHRNIRKTIRVLLH